MREKKRNEQRKILKQDLLKGYEQHVISDNLELILTNLYELILKHISTIFEIQRDKNMTDESREVNILIGASTLVQLKTLIEPFKHLMELTEEDERLFHVLNIKLDEFIEHNNRKKR